MQIVLIGPHGVGKSTLGAQLALRLGVPFHHELGRELAEAPAWRPAGATAQDSAAAFDHEVFLREFARDARAADGHRVVETWHPGNLAYAARRAPAEAARWLAAVRAAAMQHPTLVLPLVARRSTLAARQSEPGDLAYFTEVGESAWRWAVQLGLRCLPPLATDSESPAVLAERVLRRLQDQLPALPHPLRS